jgi:hypothetical protein
MAKARSVDQSALKRWRALDAEAVLRAFAEHSKRDATFVPAGRVSTARWHASVGGQDFELLLCGPKFFDTRAQRGGGGAVDFAMHLLGMDFRSAIAALRAIGL